jgi:hypothetical protein
MDYNHTTPSCLQIEKTMDLTYLQLPQLKYLIQHSSDKDLADTAWSIFQPFAQIADFRYFAKFGKTDNIKKESQTALLAHPDADDNDFKYLADEFGKTNTISNEAWSRFKDRATSTELKYFFEYGKTYNIKLDAHTILLNKPEDGNEDLVYLAENGITDEIKFQAWGKIKLSATTDIIRYFSKCIVPQQITYEAQMILFSRNNIYIGDLIDLVKNSKHADVRIGAWRRLGKDASFEDKLYFAKFSKDKSIANQSWESIKGELNTKQLREVVKFGRTDEIANEAWNLIILNPLLNEYYRDLSDAVKYGKTIYIIAEAWNMIKSIASQEDLSFLSQYAINDEIALEAWNKLKPIATLEIRICIAKYGKTDKIRLEAWEEAKYGLSPEDLDRIKKFSIAESMRIEAAELQKTLFYTFN